MKRLCAAVTALCLCASYQLLGAATDWPQWNGPNRDGCSLDKGLLKTWPTEGPKLLWKTSGIGIGYSTAIIADGLVYVTGDIGEDLMITAFDMNGTKKWQVKHDASWKGDHPGCRGSVTVSGGKLYLLSANGPLKCYDAKTGTQIWQSDIQGMFNGTRPNWSYAESPLVYGQMLVVTPGGKNCIAALNKDTGAKVWTSTGLDDPAAYSSCIAVEFEKLPMIVQMTAKGLVAVDARTGQFLWRNDRPANKTANCPTPAYSDGYVFEATGYGTGGACVKLSVEGGKLQAKQAWETKDMVCHHGGYVIRDGYIYGNHEASWACLELATGKKMWSDGGVGKGSLCYADGMLYTFGESGGKVGLVKAQPDKFEQVGAFSVAGKGTSWAHPVVTGGRLYLRYDDNLYCYDVKGPDYKEPSAAKPDEKTKPTVSQPKTEPKPAEPPKVAEPLTDEQKAKGVLNIADNYIKAGMTDQAKAKLNEVIEKFPGTEAAKAAKEKMDAIDKAADR